MPAANRRRPARSQDASLIFEVLPEAFVFMTLVPTLNNSGNTQVIQVTLAYSVMAPFYGSIAPKHVCMHFQEKRQLRAKNEANAE
jgi:hypothetical protein